MNCHQNFSILQKNNWNVWLFYTRSRKKSNSWQNFGKKLGRFDKIFQKKSGKSAKFVDFLAILFALNFGKNDQHVVEVDIENHRGHLRTVPRQCEEDDHTDQRQTVFPKQTQFTPPAALATRRTCPIAATSHAQATFHIFARAPTAPCPLPFAEMRGPGRRRFPVRRCHPAISGSTRPIAGDKLVAIFTNLH